MRPKDQNEMGSESVSMTLGVIFRNHVSAHVECSMSKKLEDGSELEADVMVKRSGRVGDAGQAVEMEEGGVLDLPLDGHRGRIVELLGWRGSSYELEVKWRVCGVDRCREGAALRWPLSPLATPEKKERRRPRKKQGVEGVQLDDGGLGALVKKLGLGRG